MAYQKDIGTRFFTGEGKFGKVVLDNDYHCPVCSMNNHNYSKKFVDKLADRIVDILNEEFEDLNE